MYPWYVLCMPRVCLYVRMYQSMHACMNASNLHIYMYTCIHAECTVYMYACCIHCVHVCMLYTLYVCMHVCIYARTCICSGMSVFKIWTKCIMQHACIHVFVCVSDRCMTVSHLWNYECTIYVSVSKIYSYIHFKDSHYRLTHTYNVRPFAFSRAWTGFDL